MPDLCFITTCMGRLSFLKQTLKLAIAQPDASVVVVDYSCPEGCGDWVERYFPGVTVVRVPGEKHYNQSRARNAGLAAADAPWICFFDCDVRLAPSFAETLRRARRPRTFLRADPWTPPLFGTFVVEQAVIREVGAYDDVYEGWGNENGDLFNRMELAGIQPLAFPGELIAHIDHDDDARTAFHEVKEKMVSFTANRLYMRVKLDHMGATGSELPRKKRQELYRRVCEVALPRLARNEPFEIEFEVSKAKMLGGHEFTRTFRYRIEPPLS
jgi:glycosyltransferase involved in cell wall biosynthesis